MPNRISALQHALENAPTSILSKYLLAKAYLSNQQHDKAAELLKSIVLDSPTDYRSSMEYVKVLLQIDENNIAQAIAVLEQSTLYGYSDARFMAMLGGLCYINRNFSRAEEVFREASKRKYPNGWKVYFDSKDIGIATEIDAEISYVGDGYAWLRISNYPNIKCRTSKYNGIPLKEKMWLKIHICASPREAVALIDKLV